MLNFFKDLLLREKVLLLSVLFLGIFLRLFSLSEISSWGDEVATWYYRDNLDLVFSSESHTPFYYFLCRLWKIITTDSVYSIRLFSIFLSYLFLYLSVRLLQKSSKFLILSLVTLWSLFPTFIIYDRQARHYGLFAEMFFFLIIIWDHRKSFDLIFFWFVFAVIQMIHPLGIIPVGLLILIDLVGKKISIKRALIYFSSSLPVLIYYLLRLYFQSYKSITSNIAWINNNSVSFLKSIFLLFAGESYPFTVMYPLNPDIFIFSSLFIIFLFLISSGWRVLLVNRQLNRFLVLFVTTILVVEFLAFLGLNLRISRYYIFLVPFLLSYIMDIVNVSPNRRFLLVSFLGITLAAYNLFVYRPWRSYPWDDDSVRAFKKDYPLYFKDKDLLICGNYLQSRYFFNTAVRDCSEEAFSRYYSKKNFSVFDIRGSQSTLALSLYLTNFGNVLDMKFYGNAFFFRFEGRK
jgi:hypothetical protein